MCNKYRNYGQWLAVLLLMVAFSVGAVYETDEPVDFTLPRLGGGEIALSDYLGSWGGGELLGDLVCPLP